MEYVFEIIDVQEFVFNTQTNLEFVFDVKNTEIGAGGTVDIVDQNNDVIATVDAGDTYQVEVLTEITDDEDLNTSTIIDPLQ